MRRLTVLSVAYPYAPVGPDAVGGAEQVLTALDEGLVAAGHRSLVLACAGSVAAGELLAFPLVAPGEMRLQPRIAAVLARHDVDLVHMHGIDFHEHLPAPGPPVLATLHLPPAWYPAGALAPARPGTWVHGVSATQAAALPAGARVLPPIANGVALEAARGRRRCGYAMMLARICPEKGVHLALEAAHAAGVALLIGGEVFPHAAHQAYFRERVAPLLDRRRRYLGPLGAVRKRRLLAGARCLLAPSLVAETSSLVAMEAAAAGTPVVAFRAGALPDIVEEGRTGFLVDDVAGMAAAMARVGALDPATIRDVARRRFGREAMVAAYLQRYAALAGGTLRAA